MFTPYMTNEELEREAYLDFLEMRTFLQMAFETFCRQHRSPGKGNRYYIHSLVSHKTYHTKRNNTWQVQFNNRCHTVNNRMLRSFLVFIPIYRNDGKADYIFFRSLSDFKPEKVTAHFIQRYKERYLEPNNIDLRGLPPAVYFEYSTGDMKNTLYYPSNWTEEDKKSKQIWLSDQGLFVTDKKYKMRVFITFLDQDNLSRYKAMIYEEENFMRSIFKAVRLKDPSKKYAIVSYLVHHYPNAKGLLDSYLRRVFYDRTDLDEFVANYLHDWDGMVKGLLAKEEAERLEERDKFQQLKQYLDINNVKP